MVRFDTLFSLRYAARVLERQSRLWGRIDAAVRFGAILAGSSALAALVGEQRTLSVTLGIIFALLQALEFSMHPARRSAEAWAARMVYQGILTKQKNLDDDALEQAYFDATSEDPVAVPEAIRRIAYNDIVEEKGCDLSHCFPLTRWQRVVDIVA